MNHQNLVRVSRFLSLILRHKPETIGLSLDANGWASISEIVRRSNDNGRRLSEEMILKIVRTDSKRRYSLNSEGTHVRANQGHSIAVDLRLTPEKPPATLYHGTVERFLPSIRQEGLKPGSRNHVHLSSDEDTAFDVGTRRGTPIVLVVDASSAWQSGRQFYLSENEVWLTERVPPDFIRNL